MLQSVIDTFVSETVETNNNQPIEWLQALTNISHFLWPISFVISSQASLLSLHNHTHWSIDYGYYQALLNGSCPNSINVDQYTTALQHWPIVLNTYVYMYIYVAIAMKLMHRLQSRTTVHNYGAPPTIPQLHLGACSSVGMWRRTDRQTDTHTQTAVDNTHFASAMLHLKCNKLTTILQSLYRSTCVSRHLRLKTGEFCCSNVLLPKWPWHQPEHSD